MLGLDQKLIELTLAAGGWCEYKLKNGSLCIEKRPSHCDRGNYWVKIFVDSGQYDLFIDDADMFPRYYFELDCLVKEMNAWIKKNKQENL